MALKIIFMGTPEFACAPLQNILEHTDHEIVAVYSQPPRPKGRGHSVQKSPVHDLAEHHNIPVHTPQSLRKDEEALEVFESYNADVAVVVAYGQILPKSFLDAPKYGCLNIHASLLPRWRGAAPIQHAIWAGDTKTGVGIMQMDVGLDTGPVIADTECAITSETTAQSLHDTLSDMGAKLIVHVLNDLSHNGSLDASLQDEDAYDLTYASMLSKDDGRIKWTETAEQIDRQVRALNPWPGVWTKTADGKRLKVHSGSVQETPEVLSDKNQAEGTIINSDGDIICGQDTVYRLETVQPENSKRMDFKSALNGGALHIDDQLK